MNLSNNCREIFLDGVTDAYLYKMNEVQFAVPFSVPRILQMNDCVLPAPQLHIATSGDDGLLADSLTAKVTEEKSGNGVVFTHEISAIITINNDNVRETCQNVAQDECFVVLRRQDDALLLCYTLPGTYLFKVATSATLSEEQRTLSFSLKSLSDFITITLEE